MRHLLRLIFIGCVCLILTSCASTIHKIQPKIQNDLVMNNAQGAIQAFDKGPAVYGPHNELLYWLDRSLVLHMTGHYKESVESFESAKKFYDALYGHTAAEIAGSTLINDYWKSYRGEDYEYVLVNIFQALNYAAIGNIDDALVEARQVDVLLKRINDRYTKDQPNVYKNDAFAHFLSGILYEAEDSSQSINDAYISYANAFSIYDQDYLPNYSTFTPRLLKLNLLTTAEVMGSSEYEEYRSKLPGIPLIAESEKKRKAQVIVIEYTGFIPLKSQDQALIPLDATHFTRLSFAKMVPRPTQVAGSTISANAKAGVEINSPTELGEDVGAIAQKVMDNRKAWMISKALLRPAAKYAIERTAEEQLRQHDHDVLAMLLNIAGDIYNVVSEKADLREWETLPSHIRIGALTLDPGTYTIKVKDFGYGNALVEERTLGTFDLKAGTQKFLITRSYR